MESKLWDYPKMMYFTILILLLKYIPNVKASLTNCGPKFEGKCNCGVDKYLDRGQEFIVSCINTEFRNTSVLQQLPPETQVLIFTGNIISDLPWNIFGTSSNLNHLRVIDMSNNSIRNILGKSFHGVGSVERLILNHNELTISSSDGDKHHHPRVFSNFVNLKELHLTDAFADNTPDDLAMDLHHIFVNSNLTRLIKLHLEQNEITGFHDDRIFCDLPDLMDLHLGDNLLKGLDCNIECLPHLRYLDLERNKITRLTAKDYKTLDSFTVRSQGFGINLDGNPFSCDCAIHELYSWLTTTNVTVTNRDALQCLPALRETNRASPVMDSKYKIQCSPETLAVLMSGPQHRATSIVLGILTVILCALLVAVVYMNRAEIRRRLTPILETVSRKVHYTSIGKPEDQEMDV